MLLIFCQRRLFFFYYFVGSSFSEGGRRREINDTSVVSCVISPNGREWAQNCHRAYLDSILLKKKLNEISPNTKEKRREREETNDGALRCQKNVMRRRTKRPCATQHNATARNREK